MSNSSEEGAKQEYSYLRGKHNFPLRESYCPKNVCQKHYRVLQCVVVGDCSEKTRNIDHVVRLLHGAPLATEYTSCAGMARIVFVCCAVSE